nr:hypothetical protein [Tanacetum cinerariifolium]
PAERFNYLVRRLGMRSLSPKELERLAKSHNIQKGTGASQKATCYEYGNQRHYRRDCSERKNQNHENQIKGTKARGVVHASGEGETEQDLNNIEDEIEA